MFLNAVPERGSRLTFPNAVPDDVLDDVPGLGARLELGGQFGFDGACSRCVSRPGAPRAPPGVPTMHPKAFPATVPTTFPTVFLNARFPTMFLAVFPNAVPG